MPNPYHDPRNGRFTTKSGGRVVANFGGSSGRKLNRDRLAAERKDRQDAAGGARNAQRQRALAGADRRLTAAVDKLSGVGSSRDQKYLSDRMARTRKAVAKINDSRAKSFGVSGGPRNPALRPNLPAKRPGGSGGPPVADSADLISLRARIDKPTARPRSTIEYAGDNSKTGRKLARWEIHANARATEARAKAARAVETAAQYNARLANDQVELAKRNNRAAGRKPLPKGFNANAMKFPVVRAEDLPTAKTSRRTGK